MSSRGRTNTFAECLTRHSSRFHFRKSRARGLRQFQFDAFAPLPHSPLTITVTVTFRSARDFHSLAAHVEQLDILHVHVNRTASLLILRSPTRVLYTGLERYIATTLPNQLFKGPHVITTTDGRGIATSAWVSLISPTRSVFVLVTHDHNQGFVSMLQQDFNSALLQGQWRSA